MKQFNIMGIAVLALAAILYHFEPNPYATVFAAQLPGAGPNLKTNRQVTSGEALAAQSRYRPVAEAIYPPYLQQAAERPIVPAYSSKKPVSTCTWIYEKGKEQAIQADTWQSEWSMHKAEMWIVLYRACLQREQFQ